MPAGGAFCWTLSAVVFGAAFFFPELTCGRVALLTALSKCGSPLQRGDDVVQRGGTEDLLFGGTSGKVNIEDCDSDSRLHKKKKTVTLCMEKNIVVA
jgi:outer membrane usher protein FimD/PapC